MPFCGHLKEFIIYLWNCFKSVVSASDRSAGKVINEDDVISGLDVRYWMLETREVEDMETAVADSPSDVQLWIKLAYKKMSDLKRK